jgi:putative ABC transport system ATP-binding protein
MNPLLVNITNGVKVHGHLDTRFVLSVPQLEIRPGEVCIVSGSSGCGKTTLLDILGCMSGFDRCEQFQYSFGGKVYDVNAAGAWGKAQLRRKHLGYILQKDGLLSYLSAWENIRLAMSMAGCGKNAPYALELARAMGIEEHLSKRPPALSIGQRQRVSIVRALATRASLLLADEPTGALDPITAESIRAELARAVRQCGATLILVTHDLRLFESIGERFFGFQLSRQDNVVCSTLYESGRAF